MDTNVLLSEVALVKSKKFRCVTNHLGTNKYLSNFNIISYVYILYTLHSAIHKVKFHSQLNYRFVESIYYL